MSEKRQNDSPTPAESASAVDLTEVDVIVSRVGRERHCVIPILHGIQDHYRYLPREALLRVCEISDITPSQIAGVSTFFKQFRHQPVGRNIIKVCVGTACHVAGAMNIHESICDALHIACDGNGAEEIVTDADGNFTIEKVACVGCCTLAPVMQSERDTYGPLRKTDVAGVLKNIEIRSHLAPATDEEEDGRELPEGCPEIRVALDSCCIAQGADHVYRALKSAVAEASVTVRVKAVGCVGMSCNSPIVEVFGAPGQNGEPFIYRQVAPHQARKIIHRHFPPANILKRVSRFMSRSVDDLLSDQNWRPIETQLLRKRGETAAAFFGPQVRVVTEHCGEIDPLDLAEYRRRGGFEAQAKVLREMSPAEVVKTVSDSGLRGRGGGGYPTGAKWTIVRNTESDVKYVIVNGDEGDPGAFMDRMVLESYPFRVIEGMAIAAYAVGAHDGIFYIRAEYPLAVKRVQRALELCVAAGLLGDNVMGCGFALNVRIVKGAGAFICGEETAMINSIEGERGTPRARPPYPAVAGLWQRPTLINNVETFANVPWIIRNGAPAFAKYGTKTSKGTKVFALAGKVQRGGMIEVPLGTTINQIVHEIGGGVGPGRRFKAIQIGGPSGGCIPAHLGDTPIDYEALRELGAIMGSGGMVVLDDTDCMVDIARYFLSFAKDESCGQCSIGRLGTARLLELMDRVCNGTGRKSDLDELEGLGKTVTVGSFCGLCKTAPNPVLTTLKYFRHEYEAHLEGRCPAGKCKSLIHYVIKDHCIGCTICAQHCPTFAIPQTPYRKHVINDDLCIKCDLCFQVCPEDAIFIQ